MSASVLYRKVGDGIEWFLIKENDDNGWEVPKTVARAGESSVRAAVRSMGEQGGMRIKVLEEVGRHGGAAKVGSRILSQRVIYYLMLHKEGNEVLGFAETGWFEPSAALRKVTSKKDKEMLKAARILLQQIRVKKRKARAVAKADLALKLKLK